MFLGRCEPAGCSPEERSGNDQESRQHNRRGKMDGNGAVKPKEERTKHEMNNSVEMREIQKKGMMTCA